MKKAVATLTLAILFLVTAAVWAEEPPHMDLVKALRATNHGDLALEYLDRLNKSGPAEVKAAIPLERARIKMDLAANEFNVGNRQKLYDQARTEFVNFIKAKPNDPQASEAQFESARILALQGRTQMAKAIRLTEDQGLVGEVQKAHDMFGQATKELRAAKDQIEQQLTKGNLPPKVNQALTQAKMQAKLEVAVSMLDRASTYEALNKNLEERGGIVKEAITDLKKLHAEDPKSPICWSAKAWAGKGFLDIDQPNEATKEFDVVLREDGPYTELAKRLTRYFLFQDAIDIRKRKPGAEIVKIGEEWLRLYPAFHNTSEGNLVRYEVAKILAAQSAALPKGEPKAKELDEKAHALFTALDTVETEFSEDVKREISKYDLRTGGNFDGDLTKVKTFPDAFKIQKSLAAKMGATEDEKERKKLMKLVQDVLMRASELADDKVPAAEIAEVRANLAYIYMANGELYKAVITGEQVAHKLAQTPKAAAGGAYALQAYGQLINDATANAAPANWVKADNDRMVKLAQYMEKTWPTDSNTDAARHQVGTLLLRQKNAKEAAAVLSRVSAGYKPPEALTDARWWWAVAAQQVAGEKEITEKEKQFYQEQALTALEGIPEVSVNVGPDIAQMYVQSKLHLGQIFFETKKYDKLESLALTLQKRLPTFKNLDGNYKKDLQATVDALVYYSQFGRATAELQAGRTAEARKIADGVLPKVAAQIKTAKASEAELRKMLEAMGKDDPKADEIKERMDRQTRAISRDSDLERGVMIVALRAAIQDENLARAQQLLKSLQGAAADSTVGPAIYVQIVQQINKQIKELEEGGKPMKPQLDKTIRSFTAFLNELGKDPRLTPDIIFFLANSYSTLGNHGDAGKLLAKIPEPGKDADDKAKNMYKAALFMSLKELRLGKQYPEAQKALAAIMKTDWGQKSIEIDKEKAALYEDQAKFGAAAVAWKDLMAKLGPRIDKDPKSKEQYYEAYYNYIACVYRFGVSQDDAKKKQENITRAAKAILKLEETQPNMGMDGLKKKYDELLNKEPVLKKEYQTAKAAAATTSK